MKPSTKPFPPKGRTTSYEDDHNFWRFISVLSIAVFVFFILALFKQAQASEYCPEWANEAKHIMIAHQDNMPLETITERLKNAPDIPEDVKSTLLEIVKEAYTVPVQEKLFQKIQVVESFADHILLVCIQNTQKGV